jgi:hypothetical protein
MKVALTQTETAPSGAVFLNPNVTGNTAKKTAFGTMYATGKLKRLSG